MMVVAGSALAASIFLWAAVVFAHGAVSHIPGDENFGVVVGRYQFLLEKKDILLGKQAHLVVRVFGLKLGAPLSGIRLLAVAKLPQAFSELPRKTAGNGSRRR